MHQHEHSLTLTITPIDFCHISTLLAVRHSGRWWSLAPWAAPSRPLCWSSARKRGRRVPRTKEERWVDTNLFEYWMVPIVLMKLDLIWYLKIYLKEWYDKLESQNAIILNYGPVFQPTNFRYSTNQFSLHLWHIVTLSFQDIAVWTNLAAAGCISHLHTECGASVDCTCSTGTWPAGWGYIALYSIPHRDRRVKSYYMTIWVLCYTCFSIFLILSLGFLKVERPHETFCFGSENQRRSSRPCLVRHPISQGGASFRATLDGLLRWGEKLDGAGTWIPIGCIFLTVFVSKQLGLLRGWVQVCWARNCWRNSAAWSSGKVSPSCRQSGGPR